MPSPIVHFQIGATDAPALIAFCREVFEWDPSEPVGPTTNIDTGANQVDPNDIHVGGSIRQLAAGADQFVSLYVRVADLDGTIEKAVARGSEIIVPRRDREGAATVVVIRAPTGHTFALIQL